MTLEWKALFPALVWVYVGMSLAFGRVKMCENLCWLHRAWAHPTVNPLRPMRKAVKIPEKIFFLMYLPLFVVQFKVTFLWGLKEQNLSVVAAATLWKCPSLIWSHFDSASLLSSSDLHCEHDIFFKWVFTVFFHGLDGAKYTQKANCIIIKIVSYSQPKDVKCISWLCLLVLYDRAPGNAVENCSTWRFMSMEKKMLYPSINSLS